MEDELQKRNTDCVYFLASPLTCKKGFECEYRHSESARLNPRDCWYWLAGNCLNPTCAFRHPPLGEAPETLSETTSVPQQASAPMTKTTVPCYFYFNSFCNKGDSCSFLHGPNGVIPAWKSSKTASTVANAHPLEHRALTGSDMVQASIKEPPNPKETTSKAVENVQFQSKVDLQESVPDDVVDKRSPSPQISMHGCEEAVINSETLLPTEDFIDGRSILCEDQSSEEQVDGHIEPEEWWESSPGFDVLVDDGSENLGQEDDPKYLLAHEREARGLHDHLFQYDYEDSVGYDPIEYSDTGILYEHGIYDSYDHVENGHISDYVQRAPKRSREMTLDPILFQKRELFGKVNDQNDVDLRDHLRKHRRIDGRQASHNPRRHGSSRLNDKSQKPARRHGRSRPFHGRMPWEVGKNMIGSQSENDTRSNDSHRLRHSQPRRNRSRQREKESRRQAKPRFIYSEISRGTVSRETRSTQESTTFTGPKTLAQIKEEKRKAREKEGGFENTMPRGRTASEDFDDPKPVREILKESRLGSMSDEYTNNRSKHYHTEPAMNHVHSDKGVDDFVDDDDEDDEGLEKKLASILS